MMMRLKIISIVSLLSCLNYLQAQELYVPPNSVVTLTPGASITTGGDLANEGAIEVQNGASITTRGALTNTNTLDILNGGTVTHEGDLTNEGTLKVGENEGTPDGQLISIGSVINEGTLTNLGIISLYKNWNNNATYDGLLGEMMFLGGADQEVTNSFLFLDHLVIDKTGTVTLMGDSVRIINDLNFINGVLTAAPGTLFIVDSSATIFHEMTSESYFDGEIITRGTRDRIFPVGSGGYFGTIEFLDIKGSYPEFGVSLIHKNPLAPIPDEGLIGVSGENTWKVDYRNGSLDSMALRIDYIAEDLENFTLENKIRRKVDSPAIAVSDSLENGIFRSLGVAELTDTDIDSVIMGILLAKEYTKFEDYGTNYYAIALEPQIDPAGQIYFPNIFSPLETDLANKTYRVFGEHVSEAHFKVEIYNRFSILVYSSTSFEESSRIGWKGDNPTGREEFTGVFYIKAQYSFTADPENIKNYKGTILLKR